jgi:hypothetical protein
VIVALLSQVATPMQRPPVEKARLHERGRILKRVAIGVALTLSIGCVSSDELAKARARYEATIPSCRTDRECELKWSAARSWLLRNSTTKIQSITADFIETFNPPNDVEFTYRITKEPDPAQVGRYRIVIFVGCHRSPSVCSKTKNPWLTAAEFNAAINSVMVAGEAPPR